MKVPGGCPSCASRCGVDSTHSLRQAASAGAKPNHAFFHCQHPHEKIFRPRRPSFAPPRAAAAAARRARRRRGPGCISNGCGKQALFFDAIGTASQRACRADGRRRRQRGAQGGFRGGKKKSPEAVRFRAAQADLRRTARTRTTGFASPAHLPERTSRSRTTVRFVLHPGSGIRRDEPRCPSPAPGLPPPRPRPARSWKRKRPHWAGVSGRRVAADAQSSSPSISSA